MSGESSVTPVALIILDGYGHREGRDHNAIARARTPFLDALTRELPTTLIDASGLDVGLPEGVMGNSEVGHMNIGAGRVCPQPLVKLNEALRDGSFMRNPVLNRAVDSALEHGNKLHLMGLVSDGGVHSHLDHLLGVLRLAAGKGLKDVFIHAFLDGRDTPPKSARHYLKVLDAAITRMNAGSFATIMGRYWGMDRDKRWDRLERAWAAMAMGQGVRARSPMHALDLSYEEGVFDEFVEPTVLSSAWGKPAAILETGDSVLLFNFRADRARQLCQVLTQEDFDGFDRKVWPRTNLYCMTEYDRNLDAPVAFDKPQYSNTLGEYISGRGLSQLRIAETEKYAHVTFFFNATVEEAYEGEDRILVPSPKVPRYDQTPEMSADEITSHLERIVPGGGYGLYVINYANADMVGHTGNLEATIKAVEAVDGCLARLVPLLRDNSIDFIITADHGNAEEMFSTSKNAPHTYHTTNPVPLIVSRKGGHLRGGGRLADVAPTILEMMGLPRPAEMEGKSLLLG